ncbi:response regulator transcription factor [Lysinibacillus irui]|uniref:Response regulator transcription factor n=1 Tax=Lysinibacillus irui TaxID=2998077 RepID=A0ABU5NPI5_9BACI|nr:response regulator transcription factor [Lysinibacillus irui]MEA0552051.1 response regulator transcription factor [Lysinibacillus irui]MEA0977976.1 response regulator transcription factor [Lysinibacillus irui]MEA1044130.1 response regulator transcription factor [Lysinibacillus irui]
MDQPIKVLLLDDHPLVMEGLKNRLESEQDMQVVETFSDPLEVIKRIGTLKPDVAVIDISMPGMTGFDLAVEIKRTYDMAIKMIVLSGYVYDEYVQKAYEIGIHAYLSKQATYPQIINAIRQSMLGLRLVPENITTLPRADQLTPTEKAVLKQIALQKTNKEIARELAMSQRTVEYHMAAINQKLEVKTRVGAVAKGYEMGLLERLYDRS